MINIWGALLSALIGGIGWIAFAFVGTPIRKFWDLRGEVVLALNQYARHVSEPPAEDILLSIITDSAIARQTASVEFRRLGLALISFWQNETLARLVLGKAGFNGRVAGRLLIDMSEAVTVTSRLGPRRSEIAAPLRLRI